MSRTRLLRWSAAASALLALSAVAADASHRGGGDRRPPAASGKAIPSIPRRAVRDGSRLGRATFRGHVGMRSRTAVAPQ